MSSILKTYGAALLTTEGRLKGVGDLDRPIGSATLTAARKYDDELKVPAGEYVTLWDSADFLRFEYLSFRIIGAGALDFAYKTDKPEDIDEDDFSASGDTPRWRHLEWLCELGMFALSSDLLLGHATAANETGDDSGVPALWTTHVATMATHKIYKAMLQNRGEEDVLIERLVIGYTP